MMKFQVVSLGDLSNVNPYAPSPRIPDLSDSGLVILDVVAQLWRLFRLIAELEEAGARAVAVPTESGDGVVVVWSKSEECPPWSFFSAEALKDTTLLPSSNVSARRLPAKDDVPRRPDFAVSTRETVAEVVVEAEEEAVEPVAAGAVKSDSEFGVRDDEPHDDGRPFISIHAFTNSELTFKRSLDDVDAPLSFVIFLPTLSAHSLGERRTLLFPDKDIREIHLAES